MTDAGAVDNFSGNSGNSALLKYLVIFGELLNVLSNDTKATIFVEFIFS